MRLKLEAKRQPQRDGKNLISNPKRYEEHPYLFTIKNLIIIIGLLILTKKGTNFSVFLDIKKAFDTIDHTILLKKLEYYGIREEELKFFSSYLHNRRQCCIVNSHQSSFQTVRCGVPQGSILGPLLFIIYMNDLPKSIENGYVTMYADDTESSTVVNTYILLGAFF